MENKTFGKDFGKNVAKAAAAAALGGAVLAGPVAGDVSAETIDDGRGLDASKAPSAGTKGGSAWSAGLLAGEAAVEAGSSGDTVSESVDSWSEMYPEYNIMFIQQETYDGPNEISGVKRKVKTEIAGNTFDIWVFESGSFTNDGDLGWRNWGFHGVYDRSEDDRTVTFH